MRSQHHASCPSANNAEQSDLTSLNSSVPCLFDFLERGGGNKCCEFLHRHGSNLAMGLWSLQSSSSPYVQLHPPTTLIQASRAPAMVLLVTVGLVLHESVARAFLLNISNLNNSSFLSDMVRGPSNNISRSQFKDPGARLWIALTRFFCNRSHNSVIWYVYAL